MAYIWHPLLARSKGPHAMWRAGSTSPGSYTIHYTILYYTILYYTILCYTMLYYAILYYTILYYTILYYTILYYTILHYTIGEQRHDEWQQLVLQLWYGPRTLRSHLHRGGLQRYSDTIIYSAILYYTILSDTICYLHLYGIQRCYTVLCYMGQGEDAGEDEASLSWYDTMQYDTMRCDTIR